MRTTRALLLISCILPTPALAAQAIDFGGERYVQAFEDLSGETDRFIEFARKGETVENWRQLVVVHWLPDMTDPGVAVRGLARVVESSGNGSNARLSENSAASEALVHFMAVKPGSKVGEVNVFKYAKASDGKGLVAVQYTFHFAVGVDRPAQVVAQRLRAVDELQHFDMAPIATFFRPAS